MHAPGSLQYLQMVPMAYRSAFRPITRAQRALPAQDLIAPADERLCNGAIAYAAGRGCRPSSDLVARVRGERMHHMCNTGFAVRLTNRLRELWLECRQACEWGPLPWHQLAHA
jgi:hypothetical protein